MRKFSMIKIENNLARVLLGINTVSISKGRIGDSELFTVLSFNEQIGKDLKSVLVSFPNSESVDLVINKLKEIKKDIKKLERKSNNKLDNK